MDRLVLHLHLDSMTCRESAVNMASKYMYLTKSHYRCLGRPCSQASPVFVLWFVEVEYMEVEEQ